LKVRHCPDGQIQGARKDAAIALAGPVAQQKFKPHKLKAMQGRIPAEWRDDYQNAQQYLMKMVMLETDPTFELSEAGTSVELNAERQEKATALFNELAAEVTTLINQHWPAIERTADELLRVRASSPACSAFPGQTDFIKRNTARPFGP
jgi:hypothetical protein